MATLTMLLWVPFCMLAAWWQVHVALSGDSLGWVYSIEWPIFACFGVYLWWFLVHDDPADVGRHRLVRLKASGAYEEVLDPAQIRARESEDEELRAYNDYLASLKSMEGQKSFRVKRGARSGS